MSLANQHRPSTFDTVIGQEHISSILKEQMKNQDKIHHNYIFFGLRGTGKTSSARILAKALNCKNPDNGNPCNTCENCAIITEGKTLDYVEIDAASHTGVDNIREEILEKAIYPPTVLKKKIYIIDEVHMLSKGAFNALLKTIEEPKDQVCFILATTEIHKIPDTILSRCQVFNFKKVDTDTMIEHLATIAKKENINYEENALELIAKMSEGSVRDAVKYVDQVSILGSLTEKNVSKFLGIASEGVLRDFVDIVKKGESEQIFLEVDKIHEQGIDLTQFAKQLIFFLDKYLLEDIDFSIAFSESISEIMRQIRYYPYPTIIFKIVLHKFISKFTYTEGGNNQTPIELNNKINQKEVNTKDEKEKKQNSIQEKEVKDQKKELQNDLQNDLRDQILQKTENESFGIMLKKYCTLKKTEEKIVITIINKMAELSLKKEENLKKIKGYFNEIGETLPLELCFKNKEDFLKEGL